MEKLLGKLFKRIIADIPTMVIIHIEKKQQPDTGVQCW